MVLGRDGGWSHERSSSAMSSSSRASETEDMWSSMLSSVASSKRLPQKTIVVLGGTAENQKEFVDSLYSSKKRGDKRPPVANQFALGYTYLDVLDADHEDVLARLGIYLVSEPQSTYTSLLRPLFTAATIPDTLLCILLDWRAPWDWMRQLRMWVRLVRGLFTQLDDDARRALDEVTHDWTSKRSTYADAGGGGTEVTLPLGPGEFDEPIGLPLCVVCQNADKIELLEKEKGWKEEQFDFILQFLRTALLKHGASLIYTVPSAPSSLKSLVFSLLSIQSTLRQNTIKHNIIDRDKVVVPPGWDSWGKIRVLRERFDVEGINNGWSVDISHGLPIGGDVEGGAVEVYEDVIKDHTKEDGLALLKSKGIEVSPVDTQDFLTEQLGALEMKKEEAKERKAGIAIGDGTAVQSTKLLQEGGVRDHVGPVQFNVGGIQMDADDMLQGIKQREASRAMVLVRDGRVGVSQASTAGGGGSGEEAKHEVLTAFFNSLINKKTPGAK